MAQPTDMVVFDNSLRPSTQKSIVRKYTDMLTAGLYSEALRGAERKVGVGPVAAALHSFRASGEAGMTGLGLGIVSATGGLDRGGVPVDLASWAAGTGLGIAFCGHEIGVTLRNAGGVSMGIFTFRKTEEFFGVRKKAGFAGEFDETIDTTGTLVGDDPIMSAAKDL